MYRSNFIIQAIYFFLISLKNLINLNFLLKWLNVNYSSKFIYINFFFKNQQLYKNIKNLKFIDLLLILNFLNWNNFLFWNFKKWNFRQINNNWNFYKNKNINNYLIILNNKNQGLFSLWNWLTYWLVSIILFLIIIYYLSYIKILMLNKIIFIWFLVIMFLYWLMSGFVYFFKKYQFSKFTSTIQRFWKRSYILFWCIESGVFLTFFYLTLNASEEPTYMYDQIKLFKTHLFSWRLFIPKLISGLVLICLGYYLKNLLKWNIFSKHIIFILSITLLMVYIVWLEFYQFFHIINYYSIFNWKFDEKNFIWLIDKEIKRTRLANNYVTVCMAAKFWHLIFIFIFWIFFILRINESERIRYFFLSANLQNFIILYLMTWLYMYPWLKFLFRNFLDFPFYWFLINTRKLGFRIFFNDIKIFFFHY